MNYDSESSEATVVSSNEIESTADNFEIAKVLNHTFQLPQDLCEDRAIFQELFSMQTWDTLSSEDVDRLSAFLPEFPENNEHERNSTVQQLFTNKISRFGTTPLESFHNNLQDGNFRPDIAHYRKQILKAEEREQRIRECERISMLAEKLVMSREKLLRNMYASSPDMISNSPTWKAENIPKQLSTTVNMRGTKRYVHEINLIKTAEDLVLSDDDEAISSGGNSKINVKPTKRQIKQLNEMDNGSNGTDLKIISTLSTRGKNFDQKTETTMTNDKFERMLRCYNKRKTIEPEHPEMEIDNVTLKDLIARSNFTSKKLALFTSNNLALKKAAALADAATRVKQEIYPMKSSPSSVNPNFTTIKAKKPSKIELQENALKAASQSETDEDDWIKANIIKIESNKTLPIQRANIKKETKMSFPKQPQQAESRKRTNDNALPIHANKKILLDASAAKGSSLSHFNQNVIKKKFTQSPESFNNDSSETIDNSPELKYETHNCFLSLIRDIFCSTCDHRMKLEELRRRIILWCKNPVAKINAWYSEVDHWENLLVSAVHFLSGEFQFQPEDFVPYLEFKSNLNIYQWIGAGRDSDVRMLSLYKYWLSRRNEMGVKAVSNMKYKSLMRSNEDFNRTKVDWKVRAATEIEICEYHAQEKRRYENPNSPFTYRQHGYDSIVGSVHTPPLSLSSKPLDTSALVTDRPNIVTNLSLVVDAVARLPNGEGTFAEICKLVKYSQYLQPNLNDHALHLFVTTALDSLCSENLNPTVQYDNKRKLWIYLHRNYSEEDFKKLHANTKQKKIIYKRVNTMDDPMRIVVNASPIMLNKNIKQTTLSVNRNSPMDVDQKIQIRSSPPPLKLATKRFIKSTGAIEPFDAEASLEAHTTPITKTTQKVQIKTESPSPKSTFTKGNPNIKGNLNINIAQNQMNSPKIATTIIGQKKIIGKPVIVGKNQAPPLLSKTITSTGDQNYSISLNVSPQSKQSEPPALCTTSSFQVSKSPSIVQHKNIVKVNTNVGKNIINSQQTPKFILTASSLQKGGKLITVPRNQTPMLSQQKQILTNVIVQQQKAKSEQILLTASNQQKIPALTISSSSSASADSSTHQSQPTKLIQIQQQPSTSIMTSQPQHQQTVYHLKQLKDGSGGSQMILKPHIIKTTNTSSSGEMLTPPLVSVSKIIKSSTGTIISPQIITTTAQKLSTETTNSPIFARVVAAGGRQLIDGILPKNSTTFKVAGSNATIQRGVLQLSGNSQYSIVSKGKNIVSVSSSSPSPSAQSKVIATSDSNSNLSISDASTSSNIILTTSSADSGHPQQSLKFVQSGPITTQQILNAKLINVQALANKGIKTTSGTIKMINSQGYIANLQKTGVPIILTKGPNTNNSNTSNDERGIVLQANPSQSGGFIINSQQSGLKLQGNVLTQSPQQTVVLGNQVLKIQSLNQLESQKASNNACIKSSMEPIVLSASNVKTQISSGAPNQERKSVTVTTTSAGTNSNQQIILGSTFKVLKNMVKTNTSPQQATRVVLTSSPGTQGGSQFGHQQIILPANFQGIKTLQGIKVIQQARLVPSSSINESSNTVISPTNKDESNK